jgi:hypothetical protein
MKRPVPVRVIVSVFLPAFALLLVLALSPMRTSALTTTPAFKVGQAVATTATTNVRTTADGKLLGTQPKDATGSIAAGPVTVPGNSVTWYQVSFVSGPSGWVGGDMLIGGVPAPVSVVVGTGTAQTMVLDEFGNIEVGFTSSLDSNSNPIYSFSESTNQGLSFSTPSVLPMLPFQTPAPIGPTIASERSGAIDVVYTCPPSVCPAGIGNPSVYMVRSIDHGATWSAPIQISIPPHPSGSGAAEPVIAACGAGVTIAWQDDGVGANFNNLNPDIFVVQVLNGVPGAPINVSNSLGSEGHPQIAVNAQSTVYLSWVADNNQGGGIATDSVVFAAIPNCGAVHK